jgi:hypothetical protein
MYAYLLLWALPGMYIVILKLNCPATQAAKCACCGWLSCSLAAGWPTLTDSQQLPIVYHPKYNITLFGIEKLHPFDSCKFEKCVSGLQQRGIISSTQQLVEPAAASMEVLGQVHSQEYLQQLHTSSVKVAQVGLDWLVAEHVVRFDVRFDAVCMLH